jgi:hypothetical protein
MVTELESLRKADKSILFQIVLGNTLQSLKTKISGVSRLPYLLLVDSGKTFVFVFSDLPDLCLMPEIYSTLKKKLQITALPRPISKPEPTEPEPETEQEPMEL